MIKQKSEKVPKPMQEKYQEITAITNAFCAQHLNDDYALLIRQAAAELARKRPSPLTRGKATGWACGLTHAIGMVNFLFDPSQTPHLKASALYQGFGVSQSTGGQKSKQVRDLLGVCSGYLQKVVTSLDSQLETPSRTQIYFHLHCIE